jgi:hypothetical protein
MPTGYTADVADGKVTKFSDFALQCARAFGALVTMRDDPMDAPIPDSIAPSTYHRDELAKARQRLTELQVMSHPDIDVAAAAAHRQKTDEAEKWDDRHADIERRYQAMINQVKAWEPPSPEHQGMKTFMLEQLNLGMEGDCRYRREAVPPLDPAKWWEDEIKSAEWSIEYHATNWEKEQSRAQGRTEWLRKLRESLKE